MLPWWAQAIIDRISIERLLWQIPFSEAAFADRVPEAVESDNASELYELYNSYVEHIKYESRKQR